MTQGRTGAATMSLSDDFVRQTERYRRELLAHCYRMLGSVNDAEDLVQETYLNAWRAYHQFEGRSSLRTWLYRIATRVCLKALERGSRRSLPSGLYAPNLAPDPAAGASGPEIGWLQPIPDVMFVPPPADPAAVVEARQSMRLALIAALQHLPARQRAVLILRDVLEWRAAEVAEALGTTTAAVNSALQRARTQLAELAPTENDLTEPAEPAQRALLDQYAAAFERSDVDALTRLLTDDADWEMPPEQAWYTGRSAIAAFLGWRLPPSGGARLVPTSANGQPAFAMYLRGDDGVHRPLQVQVLTITGAGIAQVVAFCDVDLFPVFGLPSRPGA
jgi:RNA polymerase sigma-70 factor (ECF subfamily)